MEGAALILQRSRLGYWPCASSQGAMMDVDKRIGQAGITCPLGRDNEISRPKRVIILTDSLNEGKPNARALSSFASLRISAAKHLCAHPDRPFAEFTLSEANGLRVTSDPRVFPVLIVKNHNRRWAAINRPLLADRS